MTLKEQLLKEIDLLSEEEPIIKEILEILEAKNKKPRTKAGRIVRTEKELRNTDCPYPYEEDI